MEAEGQSCTSFGLCSIVGVYPDISCYFPYNVMYFRSSGAEYTDFYFYEFFYLGLIQYFPEEQSLTKISLKLITIGSTKSMPISLYLLQRKH